MKQMEYEETVRYALRTDYIDFGFIQSWKSAGTQPL